MRTETRDDLSWVVETLRRQAMSAEEVQQVLTGDLVAVRRHLELHRERLQEQLAEDLLRVSSIERILSDATGVSGRHIRIPAR